MNEGWGHPKAQHHHLQPLHHVRPSCHGNNRGNGSKWPVLQMAGSLPLRCIQCISSALQDIRPAKLLWAIYWRIIGSSDLEMALFYAQISLSLSYELNNIR